MKLNLDKLRNTLRTTLIDIWEYVIPIWKISGLFKRIKSKQDLDMLVTTLNDNPDVKIELKSHTDFIGSNIQNKRLSQKRADECVRYLTEKGISKNRITALGMGESEPYVMEQKDGNLKIGDVLTESYIKKMRFRKNRDKANQYNRRTTFKVLIEDTSN